MEYENYIYHKKVIKDSEKKLNDFKMSLLNDFELFLKE